MFNIESIASILASMVSIGAGIYSFVYAKRSFNSASEVRKIKTAIVGRRKLVEMSQLHKETESILKRIAAIGPAARLQAIDTVNIGSLLEDLSGYSSILANNYLQLEPLAAEHARKLNDDLHDYMNRLSATTSLGEQKDIGSTMYLSVQGFLSITKNIVDKSMFNVEIDG